MTGGVNSHTACFTALRLADGSGAWISTKPFNGFNAPLLIREELVQLHLPSGQKQTFAWLLPPARFWLQFSCEASQALTFWGQWSN